MQIGLMQIMKFKIQKKSPSTESSVEFAFSNTIENENWEFVRDNNPTKEKTQWVLNATIKFRTRRRFSEASK